MIRDRQVARLPEPLQVEPVERVDGQPGACTTARPSSRTRAVRAARLRGQRRKLHARSTFAAST